MNTPKVKEKVEAIREKYRELGTIRGVTRALGVSRKLVRRVVRGEDVARRAPQAVSRTSLLTPYRATVERLVVEERLSATLVHEELKQLGFTGSYTTTKRLVRELRPASRARVTTRIEHAPGEEGQVDWSPYPVTLGTEVVIVHAFSMVLPFSRYMVLRFALDERLDTLLMLHEEAFTELGGLPRTMTYDNMTAVGRHVGSGEVKMNERFEAYRKECGFEIRLISPGRPTEHGSVERPFHYVENNCLLRRRRQFVDFEDLQTHAKQWCASVANVRVHGSTRERPVDRFARERGLLLPLPGVRPSVSRKAFRSVGADFCVAYDTNRYSVPPKYVGRAATLVEQGGMLEVWVGEEEIARHVVHPQRYQRVVLPEHEQAFVKLSQSSRVLEQGFLRLGPVAESYYEGLRLKRGRGAGFHLKRLLSLAERYGANRVVGAMSHTARYGSYSWEAVSRVLAGRFTPDEGVPSTRDLATPPPDRVKKWLEALAVESTDLESYDRKLNIEDEDTTADPVNASGEKKKGAKR